MNSYDYEVTFKFTGNFEAKNKEEVLELIKDSMLDECGIYPEDSEITLTKNTGEKNGRPKRI